MFLVIVVFIAIAAWIIFHDIMGAWVDTQSGEYFEIASHATDGYSAVSKQHNFHFQYNLIQGQIVEYEDTRERAIYDRLARRITWSDGSVWSRLHDMQSPICWAANLAQNTINGDWVGYTPDGSTVWLTLQQSVGSQAITGVVRSAAAETVTGFIAGHDILLTRAMNEKIILEWDGYYTMTCTFDRQTFNMRKF